MIFFLNSEPHHSRVWHLWDLMRGCQLPALPTYRLGAASSFCGHGVCFSVIAGALKSEPAQFALLWNCQQTLQGWFIIFRPSKLFLSQRKKHSFYFLFGIWSIGCLVHSHMSVWVTLRSHLIWLGGKRARLGKRRYHTEEDNKVVSFLEMEWPENLFCCWSSDWSLKWTKSVTEQSSASNPANPPAVAFACYLTWLPFLLLFLCHVMYAGINRSH